MIPSVLRSLPTLVLSLSLSVAASSVQAQGSGFKEIMSGMLSDMHGIVSGIMVEDYKIVSRHAEGIIYHAGLPAGKRAALLNELGMESMNFKMFDDNVRRYAKMVKKAAVMKDRKQVLETYGKLQEACTACHGSYRKRMKLRY